MNINVRCSNEVGNIAIRPKSHIGTSTAIPRGNSPGRGTVERRRRQRNATEVIHTGSHSSFFSSVKATAFCNSS